MKQKYPLFYIQKLIFKSQVWFSGILCFAIIFSLYESKPLEIIQEQINPRSPASLMSVAPLIKSTDVLKVECSSKTLSADSYQVRLESLFCENDFQELKIMNKTTGADASVFKRSPAAYTTDYIHLNAGENLISFSYKNKTSTVTRELVVIRK